MTKFGVHIYHETMGFKGTTHAQRATIIDRIATASDRVVCYTQPVGWNLWSLKDIVLDFMSLAKTKGLRTVVGCRDEGYPDEDWNEYRGEIQTILEDLEIAGTVDEVWVGVENGFRLQNWTQAQNVDNILDLIVDAAAWFSGEISYDGSWWGELDAWIGAKDDQRFPDKIFFSMYEAYPTWQGRIDLMVAGLGGVANVGEWGAKTNLAGDEAPGADNFQNKINYIKSHAISEAYCFCYRENGNPETLDWGLWVSTTDEAKPNWYILEDYFSQTGDPKMEQATYDRLKVRLNGIRAQRAQWSERSMFTALMAIMDEILDALEP